MIFIRKITICIAAIAAIIFLFSGCSKKENIKFNIFYGETEKWTVIGSESNEFQFIYKGEPADLKINNTTNNISFFYGTASGTTGLTVSLNAAAYYQAKFNDNFLVDLEPSQNDKFNGNKLVSVKINYADTTDTIDLAAYTEYKAD